MELRLSFTNLNAPGGTFATPVWFGLSNPDVDTFDLFDLDAAASVGVERIAEDGTLAEIGAEFTQEAPLGQAGALFGAGMPPVLAPGETSQTVVSDVDTAFQSHLSFMTMVIPSNDAFLGTVDPIVLFDENGVFLGEQVEIVTGNDVFDAGTELNTERDAAFLNQTAPDTGDDEDGVVTQHPGFNGSVGNPSFDPSFEANILGGVTAVGAIVDPVIGDFTADPDAPLAAFRVNIVERTEGTNGADVVFGSAADDIVTLGNGGDFARTGEGWDEIAGENGDDTLDGGAGRDSISGGAGDDLLLGGEGDDELMGGAGDDVLVGGAGDDTIYGDGADAARDNNLIVVGEGNDVIVGFDANGGTERWFDTLGVDFDFTVVEGIDGDAAAALNAVRALETSAEILAFAELLETDGSGTTDAEVDGTDLVLVFDRDAQGNAIHSVRLVDVVGGDGLVLPALVEVSADFLA